MNYSDIKYTDMLNGKGIRVSIFVSGCNHHCKECFNKVTWDPEYGSPFTPEVEEQIFGYFRKYGKSLAGLSLLGGDPTYYRNVEPLTEFLKRFKERFPEKDIWLWSGYTWEQILSDKKRFALISLCDVVVEGKFIVEQKDLSLKWKGSRNQRVVDVKRSILENRVVEYT